MDRQIGFEKAYPATLDGGMVGDPIEDLRPKGTAHTSQG